MHIGSLVLLDNSAKSAGTNFVSSYVLSISHMFSVKMRICEHMCTLYVYLTDSGISLLCMDIFPRTLEILVVNANPYIFLVTGFPLQYKLKTEENSSQTWSEWIP